MKKEVGLLDAVAKFEDCRLPLFGYLDLKEEITLEHRIRQTIKELSFTKAVFENALKRIEKYPDLKIKLKVIIDEVKENE